MKENKKIKYFFKNIKENWKKKAPDFLLFVFTVIISINPLFLEDIPMRLFLFLFLIMVLYFFKIYFEYQDFLDLESQKKTETKLENISQSLNSLPTDYLKLMCKDLGFSNAERVSIYIRTKNSFRIVGRYSSNPGYNSVNRKEYPSDEGFISKCWTNSDGTPYYYIDNLPDPKYKRYKNEVIKNVNINEETIDALTMKSRSYYVQMITSDGKFEDSNGVIVLETTDETFNMKEEDLYYFLKKQTKIPMLHALIKINKISGE